MNQKLKKKILIKEIIKQDNIYYKKRNFELSFSCESYIKNKKKITDSEIKFYIKRFKINSLINLKLYQILDFYISINKDEIYSSSTMGKGIFLLEQYYTTLIKKEILHDNEKLLKKTISIIYLNKSGLKNYSLLTRRLKRSLIKLIEYKVEFAKYLYFLIFEIEDIQLIKNELNITNNYDDSKNDDEIFEEVLEYPSYNNFEDMIIMF
jgi:hypothetical protein